MDSPLKPLKLTKSLEDLDSWKTEDVYIGHPSSPSHNGKIKLSFKNPEKKTKNIPEEASEIETRSGVVNNNNNSSINPLNLSQKGDQFKLSQEDSFSNLGHTKKTLEKKKKRDKKSWATKRRAFVRSTSSTFNLLSRLERRSSSSRTNGLLRFNAPPHPAGAYIRDQNFRAYFVHTHRLLGGSGSRESLDDFIEKSGRLIYEHDEVICEPLGGENIIKAKLTKKKIPQWFIKKRSNMITSTGYQYPLPQGTILDSKFVKSVANLIFYHRLQMNVAVRMRVNQIVLENPDSPMSDPTEARKNSLKLPTKLILTDNNKQRVSNRKIITGEYQKQYSPKSYDRRSGSSPKSLNEKTFEFPPSKKE